MYEVLVIRLCMAREEKAPQGAFSVLELYLSDGETNLLFVRRTASFFGIFER